MIPALHKKGSFAQILHARPMAEGGEVEGDKEHLLPAAHAILNAIERKDGGALAQALCDFLDLEEGEEY